MQHIRGKLQRKEKNESDKSYGTRKRRKGQKRKCGERREGTAIKNAVKVKDWI